MAKWANKQWSDRYMFVFLGSALAIGLISIFNFIVVPLEHTVYETSQILKYEELSSQYAGCKEDQNINCAAIIKDVVEFNSDLRIYKHYNEIFDLYCSDEIANLTLIGKEQ